ncbi:MAG: sugar-binding protein [Verrucomicrobiota bacterium]
MQNIKIIFLFLVLSGCAFGGFSRAEAAPQTGLLKVGKVSSPPRIDGVLDDAVWQSAVEIGPFSRKGQGKSRKSEFSRDQTRAYLCYDNSNLYVGVKCSQACLDPVNNQLTLFKKDVVTHDDEKIWRDDCVIILLDTNSGKKEFFDIMLNSLGTVLDAKYPASPSWEKGPKPWQSGAEVKTKIQMESNGYWAAEARIPFASMGMTPQNGDRWGLCIGRINMTCGGKGEQTSWPPMEDGFHNAEEFGVLEFGAEIPGIHLLDLGQFSEGENALSVKVKNNNFKPLNIRIGAEITDADKRRNIFKDYTVDAKSEKRLDFIYELTKSGDIKLRYYVQNPANLEAFYYAPLYLFKVLSSSIRITVKSKDRYQVFLNGKNIGEGARGEGVYESPLYQGENVIGIATKDKDIAVSGEVGDEQFSLDNSWKYAAAETNAWNRAEFDDEKWDDFRKEKLAGDNIYLRKNILFRQSKIWPPRGGLYLTQGATTLFWHLLEGIEKRVLEDYRFCIETPAGIEIVGATGFASPPGWGNPVADFSRSAVIKNNKKYNKYVVKFANPVGPNKRMERWQSHCYLGIKAQNDRPEDNRIYYYIETAKSAEIPNQELITVFPKLNAKTPQKHVFICRGGEENCGNSPDMQAAICATMKDCGFTHYTARKVWADKYGIKNFQSGLEWKMDLMGVIKNHPEFPRTDYAGKKLTNIGWCPTLLQEQKIQDYLEKKYAEFQKESPTDIVDWDMENNPFTYRTTCYCRECLDRFRKSANLPESAKLDAETIKSKYRTEWIDFQCDQVALTAKIIRKIIKKNTPEVIFSLYSGYQSPASKEHYSIDWRRAGEYIDIACCGYGRDIKALGDTLQALAPHRVPLLGGLLLDTPFEQMIAPQTVTKAEIIRRVLDCRGGVFFMSPAYGMDAREYMAFAEATRFITDFEAFLVNREPAPDFIIGENIDADDLVVLKQGRETLVIILNESNRDKKVNLTFKTRPGRMQDYFENQPVVADADNKLETLVPGNDFKGIICR